MEITAKTADCERFERRRSGAEDRIGVHFSRSKRASARAAEGRPHAPTRRTRLESSEVGVKVGDGLDATEIIFKGDVFIGSVSVFVRQTEAD